MKANDESQNKKHAETATKEDTPSEPSPINNTNNTRWIFYLLGGGLIVFLSYLFSSDFFSSTTKTIQSAQEVSTPSVEQEVVPINPNESSETNLPTEEPKDEEQAPKALKKIQSNVKQEIKITQADYIALADEFTNTIAFDELTRIRSASDSISIVLENMGDDNFDSSIAYFRAIPEADINYMNAQYYAGLALYQKGKAEDAIPYLHKAAENPFYLYVDHAEWYLLLAQLKVGDTASFKKVLNNIIKRGKDDPFDPPAYFEDAVKLKARLDELR